MNNVRGDIFGGDTVHYDTGIKSLQTLAGILLKLHVYVTELEAATTMEFTNQMLAVIDSFLPSVFAVLSAACQSQQP